MRRNFLLAFVLLAVPLSLHATEVFIDTVYDGINCYSPHILGPSSPSRTLYQTISICNPDSTLENFACGVAFASEDITRPVSVGEIEVLYTVPGWPNPIVFSTEEDGLSKLYMAYFSFPASPDTVEVVRVALTCTGSGSTDPYQICVDSSGLSSYDPPHFIFPLTEGVDYHTTFCYTTIYVPNCPAIEPAFVPSEFTLDPFCDELWYNFTETGCFLHNTRWEVTTGPGEFAGGSPTYHFAPGTGEAGQSYVVHFRICDDLCADGSFGLCYGPFVSVADSFRITISPNHESPTFAVGQRSNFAAETGVPLEIAPVVNDTDPCNLTFSYFWHFQDPEPPCAIDSLTGVLTYLGQSADTGNHYVYIVVDEAGAKDTLLTVIRHWESVLCGDMDHNGLRNLTDMTALVNFLFLQGAPPVPPAAGDVDCNGSTGLTDVTLLVNYLFLSGPDPCLSCP